MGMSDIPVNVLLTKAAPVSRHCLFVLESRERSDTLLQTRQTLALARSVRVLTSSRTS